MKRAVLYGSLAAIVCACSSEERGSQPGDRAADVDRGPRAGEVASPPPTPPPDVESQRQAEEEAARSFATDDPRVAKGIAENKEAFDEDGVSGVAQPQ